MSTSFKGTAKATLFIQEGAVQLSIGLWVLGLIALAVGTKFDIKELMYGGFMLIGGGLIGAGMYWGQSGTQKAVASLNDIVANLSKNMGQIQVGDNTYLPIANSSKTAVNMRNSDATFTTPTNVTPPTNILSA